MALFFFFSLELDYVLEETHLLLGLQAGRKQRVRMVKVALITPCGKQLWPVAFLKCAKVFRSCKQIFCVVEAFRWYLLRTLVGWASEIGRR